MLFSSDVRPEESPYYCGGVVLQILKAEPDGVPLLDLYKEAKAAGDFGSETFLLGLDWLYLLDALHIDEEGTVTPCS